MPEPPAGRLPAVVNLQYFCGFGRLHGNKPAGFGEHEGTFHAPALFLGLRF